MIPPLHKTTITIWSNEDPSDVELARLAQEAQDGTAYCSQQVSVLVEDPTADPAWDGTEFFGTEEPFNWFLTWRSSIEQHYDQALQKRVREAVEATGAVIVSSGGGVDFTIGEDPADDTLVMEAEEGEAVAAMEAATALLGHAVLWGRGTGSNG